MAAASFATSVPIVGRSKRLGDGDSGVEERVGQRDRSRERRRERHRHTER